MPTLRSLLEDMRVSIRMLRRTPGLTATIVLTLALGIGMASSVFSVFNAVLLRPLAYPDADRVVRIWGHDPSAPFPMKFVLGPDFLAWKEQASSFEHIVAYSPGDEAVIIDGAASRESLLEISDGFWEMSGVRLAHGRFPAPGELDALVVSHDFFGQRLGGDVEALGRPAVIEGRAVPIVGVLPPALPLQLPWPASAGLQLQNVALFRTMRVEAGSDGSIQLLSVAAKLKPGVSLDQGRTELAAIGARVAQAKAAYPGSRMTLRLSPLAAELTGDARPALRLLLAAVILVVLIACVNVANLLLGRGAARRREMAIRAAIGASRIRIVRQLLAESLVLAIAGGTTGLLVAYWSLPLILAAAPDAAPRLLEASIDGTVLAFAAVASLATALMFGVGPALSIGRVNSAFVLMSGARPFPTAAVVPRGGRLLVAIEMALAVVLLTGAGLLVKSFWRLNAHPAGFDPASVLTMTVHLSGREYDENARRKDYIQEVLRRTRVIPGVSEAGISSHGETITVARVEGAPLLAPDEMMERSSVLVNAVSEGSAAALGMRLLAGRWISDTGARAEVVINERVARRDFPSVDPVGRRVRLGGPDSAPLTIVGVVADLKYAGLDRTPEPEVYVSYAQVPPWRFTAVVRTRLEPQAIAQSVIGAVSAIDRSRPVFGARTLEEALADSIAPRRLNVLLLGAFAAAAVGLSLVGIAGVVGHSVARRTHEIGVRLALGADPHRIVTMLVGQGMGMALAGIGIGVAAAAALTRLMESLLYEVAPTDPLTFAFTAVGLALAATTASLLPALRAARIDPARTLRNP